MKHILLLLTTTLLLSACTTTPEATPTTFVLEDYTPRPTSTPPPTPTAPPSPLVTIQAGQSPVTQLAFSPDGSILAAAQDFSVKL